MKKTLLTASALTFAFSTSAFAGDDLAARIAKLEEEIRTLKRQHELEVEAKTAQQAPKIDLSSSKGLNITSPDKNFSVQLKGYAQLDGRFFASDRSSTTNKDEFLVRRARPILEGTAYQNFSFRIMPDFGGSSTRLFDGYVNYKYTDSLQVRAGKFKSPLGLEHLQSDPDTMFIERGYTSSFAPSRDIGLQLHGNLFANKIEYQLGVFNGGADLSNNDSDDDNKKDVVARLFAKPFSHSDFFHLQELGLGVAGSYGAHEGSTSKTILGDLRTPSQQTFFRYRSGTAAADTTYASGTNWHFIPQAYYYYGPFGLLAEYALASQEVTRGTSSTDLLHKAWQIEVSYLLTGEDARYKDSVKPAAPFRPSGSTLGAFELVARIGVTELDDETFPIFADPSKAAEKAETIGTGLNWYLNENVRISFNYEHTAFTGGASDNADRPDENAILSRIQYRF